MRLMLAVTLMLCLPAQAQMAYRCQAGGKVTLQSHPCAAGASETPRPYTSAPSDARAERRRAAIEAEMDQRNRQQRQQAVGSYAVHHRTYYNGELVSTSANPQVANCEVAKRQRAATLEWVGLRRSFDLLRQLDDQVYRACR